MASSATSQFPVFPPFQMPSNALSAKNYSTRPNIPRSEACVALTPCPTPKREQQDAPPLDLDAIDAALLNFAREPITPPPDPEANIARDRQLEKQSRKSLLDAGCPPCYPPELEFPLQSVLEEYEVVSYWQSLSDTARVVLTAQLSDWEDFRKYQRDIRRHCLHRKTFGDFEEKVRDRRRRHGLEGDASLHPELEKQSQLHNWIEFQNYHLHLHERYGKDLKGKTEELDTAREKLETSRLKDPTVVGFFEMGVKDHRNKLEKHKKMLLWIEQQRKAMATEQATSLQASGDHDRLSIMLTRPSPRRRKTDEARRSPLGPVRTAVSKQPVSPRKKRVRGSRSPGQRGWPAA
ncbi:uncharacterized protein K441DRAFT_652280 [Cenococcum geophilum 1.58]|uniref:uncharacterized protein n=1 Tax=Cenococcum geophilum 1.58 TaxID=794803 RepID=UPI00358FF04A|nr:hypothetical protein K441DRAFT_652280 [Cenococcum geophilum 1.58]